MAVVFIGISPVVRAISGPVSASAGISCPLWPEIGTFSITAYDPIYKEYGVAVTSKFLAVGSVVPFADVASGAIATQAWGNTEYGDKGLRLLNLEADAATTVEILTSADPQRDFRQLGIIDSGGRAAAYTGVQCQNWAGHKTGRFYTVQGNILTGPEVLDAMASTFETTEGPLAERMLAALSAGQQAGGDSRGRQSAALLVVRLAGGYSAMSDRAIDLRVDDHPDPVPELQRLLRLHATTFGLASYLQSFSAFQNRNDIPAAESCLNRALTRAETLTELDPGVLNAVAWMLVENNRELDRALKLAERAVQKDPNNAAIIDTEATICWMMGNPDRAIQCQRRAVELEPGNVELKEKLDLWLTDRAGITDARIVE